MTLIEKSSDRTSGTAFRPTADRTVEFYVDGAVMAFMLSTGRPLFAPGMQVEARLLQDVTTPVLKWGNWPTLPVLVPSALGHLGQFRLELAPSSRYTSTPQSQRRSASHEGVADLFDSIDFQVKSLRSQNHIDVSQETLAAAENVLSALGQAMQTSEDDKAWANRLADVVSGLGD